MLSLKIFVLSLSISIFTLADGVILDDKCIKCICHAVSGCYELKNCARYSISMEYWKIAGGYTTSSSQHASEKTKYDSCLQDRDCIRETIRGFADKKYEDCNEDEALDCIDFAFIHAAGTQGNSCRNPPRNQYFNPRFQRCIKTEYGENPPMRIYSMDPPPQ